MINLNHAQLRTKSSLWWHIFLYPCDIQPQANFSDKAAVEILLKAIQQTQIRQPFDLIAYCILFDHIHLLISLPIDGRYYSQIIRNVKRTTTKDVRELLGKPELLIWQDRFWEHTIRDEGDLKHHF